MWRSNSVTERSKIPHARKKDPHVHGMRKDSSTLSNPRKTSGSQDFRSTSSAGSLSSIWELELKHSAPHKSNDMVEPEKIFLESKPNKAQLASSDNRSKLSSSTQMSMDRYDSSNLENSDRLANNDNVDKEQKSRYGGRKGTMDLSKIPLPQSAASYYNGILLPADVTFPEMCASISKLNCYLKASKVEVRAGVPGRYLLALIGQEFTGSVVSTMMYAYFLTEMKPDSRLCTIPVINMKRADLNTYTEVKWLLKSCHIDVASLIFIDEIDLSYYDLFGNLKLVLVNGNKLPAKLEGLAEALVESSNCTEVELPYTWIKEVNSRQDASCCTAVAEKFAETSPEILAGHGFSRLLLSGILLDTANLTDPNCTSKDKYMATLLIKGASRLGCNGLYEMLRYKMFDISDLKMREILQRDFKKWTKLAGKPSGTASRLTIAHIGMSSIGFSIEQFLAHGVSAAEEVIQFQESENLRLLMVVSGYEDSQKKFKREILVSTNTAELMRNFIHFFDAQGAHLPLKPLDQPDLREEMRVFEINNNMISRRSIERLLEEFGGVLRKQ